MGNIPKKQQDYFNQIKKALGSGDEEMLSELLRQKDPLAIRHDLSTTLGQHVRENYDNPLNIFENKKLLEKVPVSYTKDLPVNLGGRHRYVKDPAGFYTQEGTGIFLRPEDLDVAEKQMGTRLHEYGHADDLINYPELISKGSIDKSYSKLEGLQAAEEAIGKHHGSGFFEKDALEKLLQNKKLGGKVDTKELMTHLADYSSKVGSGGAKTADFMEVKNMGRAPIDVLPEKILEKGGSVLPAEGMTSRFSGTMGKLEKPAQDFGKVVLKDAPKSAEALKLLKGSGGFAHLMPQVGLGALAAGSLGVAKKLQDQDFGGAAVEAADAGSYLVPGLGEARMLGDVSMGELGNSELPPEELEKQARFNQVRQRLAGK